MKRLGAASVRGLARATGRGRLCRGGAGASRSWVARSDAEPTPDPTRGAAGFEVGMSDGDSTGLIGIAFWCIALAAFLLWALKHIDLRL